MTVKIVGNEKAKRVTCPECLSILEYEPLDRFWIMVIHKAVPVLRCPECDNTIRLE